MKHLSLKHLLLLLALFIVQTSVAQEPTGYYDAAANLRGKSLKTALFNIIKNHNDLGYDALYTTYQTSDNIIVDGNNYVWDMYSFRADGTAPYYFSHSNTNRCGSYKNEGDCYNREHVVPQSWFSKQSPMRNDAHHVVPTDGKVNGIRGNLPHAEVGNNAETTKNGSKCGTCSTPGYNGRVFEPIDAFKGDFARIYFYMVTRYEDRIASWKGEIFDGRSYPAFKKWYIDMLLKWHRSDPVSQKEIVRNNAIYARQNNRNPFIDHPEFAGLIWDVDTVELYFSTTPVTSATEGQTYLYNVEVQPNTSTVNISAPTKPAWLNFNITGNGRATLSGTPFGSDVGTHSVVLNASNGTSNVEQKFNIEVKATETPDTTLFYESFTNMPPEAKSYYKFNFTGDNNFQWNAIDARTDQRIDGSRAIALNASVTAALVGPELSGGCVSVMLTHQLVDAGTGGQISVVLNVDTVARVAVGPNALTDSLALAVNGNFVLELRNSGAVPVKIDNLKWRTSTRSWDTTTYLNGSKVHLFPNPANSTLTIDNGHFGINLVQIYTTMGQRVLYFPAPQHAGPVTIDVAALRPGIYFVKINTTKSSVTAKFIKR